jgi:drug/metabolite transporter (DMT)-like permease
MSDAGDGRVAERRIVPLVLGAAVVAVSFAAVFFRKASPTHPLVMSGMRLAAAAIVLAPWTVRSIIRNPLRGRILKHAATAGVLYGLHFGTWVTSLTLTGIAASVTLVTITPLLLAVLGLITGNDRPSGKIWIALALATIGLFFIGGADLAGGWGRVAGDMLAVAGAVTMAGYLLVGRRLGGDMDLVAFSGIATAVGAVLLLSSAALIGVPLKAASTEALIYILLAALIPQLIGHNLLTWCLRHTKPATVGMAIVGEPVGATILGAIWLKESVMPMTAVGCAVILCGIALTLFNNPQR